MAREIRQRHPGMGLYWVMADQVHYERDWCEQLLFEHGFGLKRACRSFTQSRPEVGANLIEGMRIDEENLKSIRPDDMKKLMLVYKQKRVNSFLKSLAKELGHD